MVGAAVAVMNGKGGTLKTSVTANVGGLAAAGGYRVLLVDLDPQGNLARDLGYGPRSDAGAGLLMAMYQGGEPRRLKVRENLDVVPGGARLADWAGISFGRYNRSDVSLGAALARVLDSLAGDYDLVMIDTPPGEQTLQRQAAVAARWVVIPTGADDASLDGMVRVAELFRQVAADNPRLELLGVVLTRVASSARAIRRQAREKITNEFGAEDVLFEAVIRDSPRTAVDCRSRGQLVYEYEEAVVAQGSYWRTRRAGLPREPLAEAAPGLAADYAALTKQILTRHLAALRPTSQGVVR
jgi:cellulose biosynthesis protein BcsQ